MTNPASPANLIFHNGQVLTMDPASTIVSAVAVSGESIQAVGNARYLWLARQRRL